MNKMFEVLRNIYIHLNLFTRLTDGSTILNVTITHVSLAVFESFFHTV